ncbi:MAG: acyl-CoA thioesterase [Proteobacteria bacterium]|nr:MAG: acyl-CoA thioesterase [Pseudomonadota bacterium]
MVETESYASAQRQDFKYFHTIGLRWNDLDAYRHVNNARYYAFYDTVIMHYLTIEGGFDLLDVPIVPFTVENLCRFHKSFRYPTDVECGLRVARIGTSSVRYELGLFARGESEIVASGYFIDVFVERSSETPCPIPTEIRDHLLKIITNVAS